eukprot:11327839-Alexandrium_andersonii.AAC.1
MLGAVLCTRARKLYHALGHEGLVMSVLRRIHSCACEARRLRAARAPVLLPSSVVPRRDTSWRASAQAAGLCLGPEDARAEA